MLIENGVMTGTDVLSGVFFLGDAKNYSVHAEWTGTPTGTLKLQGSGKYPQGLVSGNTLPPFVDSDFVDITDATAATGGAAGEQLFDVEDASYAWVKVVYTNTSGTGVLNVVGNKK